MNKFLSIIIIVFCVYQFGFNTEPDKHQSQIPNVKHLAYDLPIDGRITSTFGPRWGRHHNGIDIAAAKGTQIQAWKSGYVLATGRDGTRGKYVIVDHNDCVTHYFHLSHINVNVGEVVNESTVLGEVGNTGRSTGNHLHFEIRKNGKPIDPLK